MLNGERMNAFPLQSGGKKQTKTKQNKKQWCPLIFNIALEFLAKAIEQKKE